MRVLVCSVIVALGLGCVGSTRLAGVTEVTAPTARRIDIEAGRHRFIPNELHARVGEIVTLVFTRTDDDACLAHVILYVEGDRRIERDLPMGQPVAVTLRLEGSGEVGITCAKGGHGAALVVVP